MSDQKWVPCVNLPRLRDHVKSLCRESRLGKAGTREIRVAGEELREGLDPVTQLPFDNLWVRLDVDTSEKWTIVAGLKPEERQKHLDLDARIESAISQAVHAEPPRPECEPERFLTAVAVCERQLGWTSSKKAAETDVPCTGDLAWTLAFPPSDHDERSEWRFWVEDCQLVATSEDREVARKAIMWLREVDARGNDYLKKLVTHSTLMVDHHTRRLVASSLQAYRREHRPPVVSKHVGEIGTREELADVVCVGIKGWESTYGWTTLCRFEDVDGNRLVWFATGDASWVKEDGVYDIVATIKAHDDYKGTAQTVMTRVRQSKGES